MSQIQTVLNGVVDSVNEYSCDGASLSARVEYGSDLSVASVKTRQVVVTPQVYSLEHLARGLVLPMFLINVGFFERIERKDVFQYIEYVEGLAKHLILHKMQSAVIAKVEFEPLYDVAMLRNNSIFASVLTLTVKVVK